MRLFEWRKEACWKPLLRRKQSAPRILSYLNNFDVFATFHGCRPLSVEPYYREGLKLADHDFLSAEARKIFVADEFSEISPEKFDQVTSEISRIDHQKAYVVLDPDELIQYCGHYLIYGSEHICGVAASLQEQGSRDYRQILKRFGTPTVIRIELPRTFIPARQLEQLAEDLSFTCEEFAGAGEPPYLSWTFVFDRAIPAEYVMSHSHPESIPDPLLRQLPYRYRDDGTERDLAKYL